MKEFSRGGVVHDDGFSSISYQNMCCIFLGFKGFQFPCRLQSTSMDRTRDGFSIIFKTSILKES